MDDYEDKKMQLEGLKNRLEATVSPHIVKAFTTYNLGNEFSWTIVLYSLQPYTREILKKTFSFS